MCPLFARHAPTPASPSGENDKPETSTPNFIAIFQLLSAAIHYSLVPAPTLSDVRFAFRQPAKSPGHVNPVEALRTE